MILKDQMRVIKLITINDIPGTTLILRVARVKYAVIHIHPLCLTSLFFYVPQILTEPQHSSYNGWPCFSLSPRLLAYP